MFNKSWLEGPVVPIVLYDPHNPPFQNTLVAKISEELAPFGGFIIASILNEAGQKAYTNQARMFCYNLLIQNYGMNSDMEEVVNYVCKATILGTRRGIYKYHDQGITSEVSRVLTLYSSALVFRYDQLKSVCAPNVINAAYQNVANFNTFKQEIETMNQFVNQQGFPVQQPMVNSHQPMMSYNGGAMSHPNMVHMAHPMPHGGFDPRYSGMSSAGMPNMNMGYGYPPPPPPPVMAVEMEGRRIPDSSFQRFQRPSQPMQEFSPSVNPASMERYARTNGRVQELDLGSNEPIPVPGNAGFSIKQPAAENINTQVVQQDKKKVTVSQLDIEGGTEMDRERHRIVVMDQTLAIDLDDRFKRLTKSVNALLTGSNEVPTKLDIEICDTNLENFINQVRVNKLLNDRSGISNIYFANGYLAEPIVYVHDTPEFPTEKANAVFDAIEASLLECENFSSLADALKKIAKELNDRRFTSEDDKKISQIEFEAVFSFLTTLDKKLTKQINDFLKYDLRVSTKIDSFTDDANDLIEFIKKKYTPKQIEAYRVYEDSILNVAFIDEKDINDAVYSTVNSDQSKTTIKSIVSCIGVTVVNITSSELGYKFGDGVNIINSTKFPTLHKLAKAVWSDAQKPYANNYMVTSDNEIYRIHCDYVNSGEFSLSKLS